MSKKYIIGFGLLILVAIIATGFYFCKIKSSPTGVAQNAQAPQLTVYKNSEYGFEISYPDNLTATTTFKNYYHLVSNWRADAIVDNNGESAGLPVISIPVYRIDNNSGVYISYPLYFDAELRIGVSSDSKDVQTCLLSTNGISGSTETINGINFSKFTIEEAGMSQYLEGVSYRTIHNGVCYAIEQLKTGSSYRDAPNPKDIPDSVLDSYYNQIPDIIKTFKFTSADTSACFCRDGYVQEGNVCTPKCYYSTPKCLLPSYICGK